jgi:hypothetical protein
MLFYSFLWWCSIHLSNATAMKKAYCWLKVRNIRYKYAIKKKN